MVYLYQIKKKGATNYCQIWMHLKMVILIERSQKIYMSRKKLLRVIEMLATLIVVVLYSIHIHTNRTVHFSILLI